MADGLIQFNMLSTKFSARETVPSINSASELLVIASDIVRDGYFI
jgi:hypothetical protein